MKKEIYKRGNGWVRRRAVAEPVAEKAPTAVPLVINLNTASLHELCLLEGVDMETAERIVVHRPFTSVDELTRVGGIGPARLERNREIITV